MKRGDYDYNHTSSSSQHTILIILILIGFVALGGLILGLTLLTSIL